ncbi:MAG: phage integrase family protein [Burkholderiaceae bacterium]|nr:phage integrase family protein [Burkholderiaceae bacterium]
MSSLTPSFVTPTPSLFHSGVMVRRKAGRPLGSKAQVVQDARALGVHHFAFVRSSILGLDLAESFQRYMAWAESTTDLRYVQNRREALLKRIIEAGRQHDATLPSHSKITRLLDLLRSDAATPKAVQLPSLDEWIETEGMDPEGWSEAELLAEYKAHFGLDNVDAIEAAAEFKDPVGERVRALNYLETVLSVIPTATDRLESWFARPVVKCLRNMGIITLGDLAHFINAYGHRWYSTIKGFGAQRAKQVLHWLTLEQDHLNLLVSASVHEPKSKRELRVAALLPSVGQDSLAVRQFGAGTLVASAIQRMQATPALAGGTGDFRSHMANTLGAKNDLEAVSAWLSRYNEKPSTQRSYRKETERFLLWCAQELKKPLSSVNSPDCQKYREFLQTVPATWIQHRPLKRTDPGWRAFRSQPSAASQKQALVILQTLFGGLVDAGYLVANPMRSLMKGFDLPASRMDIRRSFTEAEWAHVLTCVDAQPVGPERLRLKCILELLVTSGIRLDELAKARHKDLRLETLPDLPETWILTVTGKRNKTREVPLNPDVVKLLGLHGGEFREEDKGAADKDNLPLIRTLGASVPQWRKGQGGELVTTSATEQAGSALSASGIYAVLKRFFKLAAKSAAQVGLDEKRFEKASTHWMRHTFVRQALVDGVPIEVASELAGHASIDTTSIYSTQELARKIKAVQGMKRRVAA